MNVDQEIKLIRSNLIDQDWVSPKTVISDSSIGGKGLFAIENIKKDELVVVWGGEYVSEEEARKAEENGFLIMQWDDDLFSVEERGESEGYKKNIEGIFHH